ncbi:MAG: Uma2 family endonuclease, partial [Burkholderiales bacterium]
MGFPQHQLLHERQYLSQELDATEKHEFVDGVAYAMAGASERHNRIALNCAVTLRMATRGTSCGVYIADMKLRLAQGRVFYYPDVMLSCEPAPADALFKEAPCLIAEVLSPSTAGTDTREKLQAYRAIESLRYYLVIDSERVALTYYSRSSGGEWLT